MGRNPSELHVLNRHSVYGRVNWPMLIENEYSAAVDRYMGGPSTKDDPMTLTPDELALVTISSLRYAMGRKSYIVGDTIDFIKKAWPHMAPEDRKVCLKDLNTELAAERLGSETAWSNLSVWMASYKAGV